MKRGSTVQYLYKRPDSNESNIGVVTVKTKYRVLVCFEDGTRLARRASSFRLLGH